MSVKLAARVNLFENRRAVFSECETYRYLLESVWDPTLPIVAFCMLNPATASHLNTDRTNVRCRGFAQAWGYGGLRFVNLFAFRATDPKDMLRAADPIGPENDKAILEATRDAGLTVCGWGNHGGHLDRAAAVARLLTEASVPLHAISMTGQGVPAHPLYLPKNLHPVSWTPQP